MADLTANRTPNTLGLPEVCLIRRPVGPLGLNTPDPNGSTGITIYEGALCGYNTLGNVDNIDSSTSTIVTVAGVSEAYHSSVAGTPAGATLTNIPLVKGPISFLCDGTVTATLPYGTDLYAVDNQTLSADPGVGRIRAGFFEGMDPSNTANCICQVGQASPLATAPSTPGGGSRPFYARGVFITTAVASYTGSGTGTLTAGSNQALESQDGIAYAVNDVIMVPAGVLGSLTITAKDAGPYVVSALGGASAKFVLKRPSWWQHGAAILTMAAVKIGPEGTLFGGQGDWSSWAAPAKVIDTDDPLFYPDRVNLQVTLSAGVLAITTVPLRSATKTTVLPTYAGSGTPNAATLSYQAGVVTPGALGTASVTVGSYKAAMAAQNTDTSVLNVLICNR